MRKTRQSRLGLRLLAALAAILSAAGGVQAAQLVTFTRGQSIVVQSAEKRGAWYYFILEGGGELGVPTSRVASIVDYEPPPVSVAPAASAVPSVSPAVHQAAPQQSASQQPIPGNPAPPVAANQQAEPGSAPPASQPNVAAQGDDEWRYKVRMGAGPTRQAPNLYGTGGAGAALSGRRVPPGGQRRVPPASQQQQQQQQQNPQN